MDDKMIFQKLQKGDIIFSLERDRRALYPIFDQARILKVGESKPMASMVKDGFVNSLELVIQDSVSQITIYLPSQAEERKVFTMVFIIPLIWTTLLVKFLIRDRMQ